MRVKQVDKLAAWIDAYTLAEMIMEALKEGEAKASFENGQKVWLDMLGFELQTGLRDTVKALFPR